MAAQQIDRPVRLEETLAIVGAKRSWWYAEIAAGRAPAPRKRGRCSLWLESELRAYVAAFTADTEAPAARGVAQQVAE